MSLDAIIKQEEVKEEIYELLKLVKRKGIKKLVESLDELGYFKAPASTQYHLNYEGGLAEHSLNVCKMALNMFERMQPELFPEITTENIIISALFHDLGKSKFFEIEEYQPNFLKGGVRSDKKPWKISKERPPIQHSVASIIILENYIKLTKEEMTAIMYHDGLYDNIGRFLSGKEQPLQQLIHYSDMWNYRFIERIGSDESEE